MPTPRKAGRMTIWQRTEAKNKFIEVYAATHNIRKSTKAAGIDKMTFYTWVRNGTLSQTDLAFAEDLYRDDIRDRMQYRTYDPWATFISPKQVLRLAKRHLPEYQGRVFGEVNIDTRWWNDEERLELSRLISRTNAAVAERRKQYAASKHQEEYI